MNKHKRIKGKKGNTQLFSWVLAASGVLIVLGLVAFVIASLTTTGVVCDTGYTYNESAGNCYLNTNQSVKAQINSAGSVFNNTLTMFTNFTGQLGTIGTLSGVLLIFGVLGAAGIGLWMGYTRVRGGGFM